MTGVHGDESLPCRAERSWYGVVSVCLLVFMACPSLAGAQVSAAISGVATDASGAAISAATVTARNLETGAVRTTVTDAAGRYPLPVLAVGAYEVTVAKDGFQTTVRDGIHLVVGQHASLDIRLQVGVQEQVNVIGEVSPVNTMTTDISGLVGEQQVKDLPLNGRSYDLLTLLNPGVVNFTWEKTGGIGISNSTTANMFSVSGNRPQQNLFLLNGVEFTGAAENNMTPGGASGQLLGIDAVREFNILRDTYSAEYGKKPGGQISIVTQSGSNQWHGSIFEFLRNSALDAPNYFDVGSSPPPFRRNQFGGLAGRPDPERQGLRVRQLRGVHRKSAPDLGGIRSRPAQSRLDASPIVISNGAWTVEPVAGGPFAGAPDFKVTANGDGVAQVLSSPLQRIQEHFGTLRLDHRFSSADSVGAVYTIDDSHSNTATPLDPYSTDLLTLREQVFSVQETHVFSPTLLNTARFGYSRAGYFFTGEPTPGTPAASGPAFLAGLPVGAVVVGGSQASNPQAQLGLAGSNNGSNLSIARNLFTLTDDMALTRGRHQVRVGVWLQPFQSNEEIAAPQPQVWPADLYRTAKLPGRRHGRVSGVRPHTDTDELAFAVRRLGMRRRCDPRRVGCHRVIGLPRRIQHRAGTRPVDRPPTMRWVARARCARHNRRPTSGLPQVGNSPLFTINRAKFLPQPRIASRVESLRQEDGYDPCRVSGMY